ncbi:hypothetical protein MNBD_ALPHA09-2140 [hydrothermal vent metagenome]|uniref:Heme iron utilization protein n=1 Tax=hydrothermal vent metagenome TaxID=652676 RepID=A0A3B0T558_9ZZZZ
MPVNSNRSVPETKPVSAGAARHIVRGAGTASLATLEASSGAPYASLVSVATLPSGAPIMTMSSLSHHHANIAADARVSLLFDGTPGQGNPLEGGRVSVSGRAVQVEDEEAARRFMARHREAFYTGFGDFGFFVIDIDRVHFVAGLGRARWFKAAGFEVGSELAETEADILAHVNSAHADDIAAYATGALKGPPGCWRISGIDVEGADLECNGVTLRLDFPHPATTPEEARAMLAERVGRTPGD